MTAAETESFVNALHRTRVATTVYHELVKAEQIILRMLNALTTEQKDIAYAKLIADGVGGEGMTRYHERRGALDAMRRVMDADALIGATQTGFGVSMDGDWRATASLLSDLHVSPTAAS